MVDKLIIDQERGKKVRKVEEKGEKRTVNISELWISRRGRKK